MINSCGLASYSNLESSSNQKNGKAAPVTQPASGSDADVINDASADSVAFSSEGRKLAANQTQAGATPATAVVEQTSAASNNEQVNQPAQAGNLNSTGTEKNAAKSIPADQEIAWGPDLIDGWKDENYLYSGDDGYKGSLSFSTKHGSKVGIFAGEANEDGSLSKEVTFVLQRKDGQMFSYTLSATESETLRITESAEGFDVFHGDSAEVGSDQDDIIVSTGGRVEAGGGDDVIVSLKSNFFKEYQSKEAMQASNRRVIQNDFVSTNSATNNGGDGDDTIVVLDSANKEYGSSTSGDAGNDKIYIRNLSGSKFMSYVLGSTSRNEEFEQDVIVIDRMGRNGYLYNGGNNCQQDINIGVLDGGRVHLEGNNCQQDINIAVLDGGNIKLNGNNGAYNLVADKSTCTKTGSTILTEGESNTIRANIHNLENVNCSFASKNSTVDVTVGHINSKSALHLGADGSTTTAKVGTVYGAVTAGQGKNNITIDAANNAFIASYGGDNNFNITSLKNSLVFLDGGGAKIKVDKAEKNVVFDSGGNSLSGTLANSLDSLYFTSKDKKKFEQWARQFALQYAGGTNYGL